MKTILFDLDDTLIESMHVWEDAIVHLFEKMNLTMDIEEAREIFTKMKFAEVLTYIKNTFQTEQDEKWMFNEVQKDIYDQYANHIQEKKGALDFIKLCSAKNIKMAVLTSNMKALTDIVLKRLGMFDYIQKVYSADALHMTKREPQIYEYVLTDLNAKKEETTLFEDSMYAIETAQKLGIQCIGLLNMNNEEAFKKNQVKTIHDFTELCK